MTQQQCLIGTTVQLKSGGPNMTVDLINDEGKIRCQWFDNSAQLQHNWFAPESLELIDELRAEDFNRFNEG